MLANDIRIIVEDKREKMNLAEAAESTKCYNEIIKSIRTEAANGKRFVYVEMKYIKYSVIPRLLADGFYIEDSSQGYMAVNW